MCARLLDGGGGIALAGRRSYQQFARVRALSNRANASATGDDSRAADARASRAATAGDGGDDDDDDDDDDDAGKHR